MPKEPDITINGRKLTTGQAMTVRVAIETFLRHVDGRYHRQRRDGRDHIIENAYLARTREIRAFYTPA